MYAYKTNSADYLDYVASQMTREQILADPDKCVLLENEYIKDNMEIALRWAEAKNGEYKDKYEFVEFLICNGPELDADTILHYRAKAVNDPVCMEIAYSYLPDINTIKNIRRQKYKKETDDCFSNPCFYLGRFSAVMGSTGDVKATYSPFNRIADWLWSSSHVEQAEALYGKQLQQGMISQTEYNSRIREAELKDQEEERQRKIEENLLDGNKEKVTPSGGGVPSGQEAAAKHPATGGGRPCFEQGVIPSVVKGWKMMMGQILEGNADFSKQLVEKTNCLTNAKRVGDWMSSPIAEMIDLSSKANVKRHLGDCARLWSQVRRLRLFGEENSYAPVTPDMLVNNTHVDGTPMNPIAKPNPKASEMSVAVEQTAKVTKQLKKRKVKQKTQLKKRTTNDIQINIPKHINTIGFTNPELVDKNGVVDLTKL